MKLETERLILRPFEDRDAEAFSNINADPKVMRYFPEPYSTEKTKKLLDVFADKQERYGYAFSAVERKEDGCLLGMNGLSPLERGAPFVPCTEIGWRLTPSAWGKGYATEAAKAWLTYGFETLNLPEILSYTPTLNTPSQQVMQRIGMERAQDLDFDHPDLADDSPLRSMVVYRMVR